MHTIVLIALLASLSIPFKVRPFEALAWTVLTSPVWIYLTLMVFPPSIPLYWIVIILNMLGWCLLRRNELEANPVTIPGESIAIAALIGFATVISFLTSQWDEFFPMGERLRDYALLSSVVRSPFILSDPWLHGYGLNYYSFWYRVGNMLSVVLHLSPPAIYNQIQVLTFSLYLGAVYRMTNRFLGWSWIGGLFSALVIGFGSNIDGVFAVMMKNDGWWGPSRVIKGAINEFPAWSFLLGDVHPHFLNLSMIPLMLILFFHLTEKMKGAENLLRFVLTGISFLLVGSLLIYNANAWEVPVWGLAMGGVLVSRILNDLKTGKDGEQLKSGLKFRANFLAPLLVVVTALLVVSLWYSSRNILPNPFPVHRVKDPISQTSFFEFFRHWGIPVLAMLTLLLTSSRRMLLSVMIIVATLATLLTGGAAPMLWAALIVTGVTFFQELRRHEVSSAGIITGVITVVSIVLCLVPEYIFLDDPYGGENERMNTIFKMYSSNWFFFHLCALSMGREFLSRLTITGNVKTAAMVSLLLFSSAFFIVTVKQRKTSDRPNAVTYGSLASVADNFPGGADTVLFLRSQPGMVVLEAQGDAYSWTSYVSTLSDKDSYLGWANHVNLLIREYGEISRREQNSSRFYTSASCEERRRILEQESIDFAVVGSLEFKKHPQSRNLDYSCLKQVFSNQEYRVFTR